MVRYLTTLLAGLASVLAFTTTPASADGDHGDQKVTICHQTSAEDNLYNEIEIPAEQLVDGVGHGAHEGDIWAAFTYYQPGPNIEVPAQGDQAILANECEVPTTDPPGPVPNTDCPPRNLFNAIPGTRSSDVLIGTKCRDLILGRNGNDRMWGLGERDLMVGGRGNDRLEGGAGNDILVGLLGRDRLRGDSGRDRLRGGFRGDRLVAADGAPGDLLIGGAGRDVCIIDPGDRVRMCERVVVR